MKKLIFTALLLAQALLASAQLFIDGQRLDLSNTGVYLEAIILIRDNDDPKYYVSIDYGQRMKPGLEKGDFLTDEGGRRFEFRSVVDCLNFLFENGWEVNQVYVYKDIRRYLLKRK